MEGLTIKKIKRHTDERGWLTEAHREDEWEIVPVMSYVSMTNPGVTRGPHEHEKQTDGFVFVGPGEFEFHAWDNRKDSPTYGEHIVLKVGERNPTALLVAPGIVHGYKCVSDRPGFMLNLPDVMYKGVGKKEEVDEIRWENDPESPFQINS